MIPRGEQWEEIAGLAAGKLGRTSYAVVLAAMARAGRSGVLQLSRTPVEKRIFLADGKPIECRSNLAHETFGRFLKTEGRLSDEEHDAVLAESLGRRVPLGEVLIERGLLSPHEIYRYLQKNLARKLLDGFTWERGVFEFSEDEGADADPTVKINTLQLILTGVLKLTPLGEIRAGLGSLGGEALKLDPRPPFENAQLRLSTGSRRVLQELEPGPLTVDELKSAVSASADEVDRVLYALALVGRVLPASEISRHSEPPAAAPAPASPAPSPAEEPAAAEEEVDQSLLLRQAIIVESYLSFNRKDSFEFLEIDEGSSPAEIDQGFLQAAETYAPWSLTATSAGDFGEQAEILFLRAAQAYAELKNTESRGTLVHRRRVVREEEAQRKKPKFSIETDLLDSEEQFKKGLALVESGKLGKALKVLEFAADCDPQSALYRAELAYRRDQFDPHRFRKDSIRDLEEALRIDPGCGVAHYYLGLIFADQGDLARAEKVLRASIKPMAPDRRPIEALKGLGGKKKR